MQKIIAESKMPIKITRKKEFGIALFLNYLLQALDERKLRSVLLNFANFLFFYSK